MQQYPTRRRWGFWEMKYFRGKIFFSQHWSKKGMFCSTHSVPNCPFRDGPGLQNRSLLIVEHLFIIKKMFSPPQLIISSVPALVTGVAVEENGGSDPQTGRCNVTVNYFILYTYSKQSVTFIASSCLVWAFQYNLQNVNLPTFADM